MINLYILLTLALIPVIILGYFIYKKDKIEKEPPGLLLSLFFGGVFSAIITMIITSVISIFVPIFDDEFTNNLSLIGLIPYCFLAIGLVEEFSKWIVLKVATWKHNSFNHIYDAIVYACFVSLGFAAIENIMYVFDGGIITALTRAIFSIPGHTFFGVFMGVYYGLAKQAEFNNNIKLRDKNLFLSLIVPTILHGIFDYCLFTMNIIFILLFLVFVIILYIVSFIKINKISKIKNNFTINGNIIRPVSNTVNNEMNYNNQVIKKSFCVNCGTEITSNYCYKCGTKRQ